MSNTMFAKSVDGFVSAQSKGEGAFGHLVMFAYELVKELTEGQADALKNAVKTEEASYRVEHPKMAEFPPAYRSAKSVVHNAVVHNVALVGEDGKPKGKTALEKETKEAKGSTKTELEKFRTTMTTANAIFSKLDTAYDIGEAYKLVAELADIVCKAKASCTAKAA